MADNHNVPTATDGICMNPWADHDAHFGGEAMQAMAPRFFSLLAEEPEVVY